MSALAYNTRAAERDQAAVRRTSSRRDGPHIRTLNSLGLWICNEFGPVGPAPGARGAGRPRSAPGAVRDPAPGQHRHRGALSSPPCPPSASGSLAGGRRGGRSRRRGHRRGVRPLPGGAGRTGRGRLRRADLPGHRDPPDRSRRPGSAQARCRRLLVDEFQDLNPGPPAADPAAGRPGLRLLRGRRRRPGHLRLLRGDPRVPHRLRPLLPRGRRTTPWR